MHSKSTLLFYLLLGSTCFHSIARAAPISITQVSNLDFGTALWGDPPKRVAPGNSDDAENASFLVTGDPRRTFTISLPTQIWLNHISRADRILVSDFDSRPNNTRLGRDGQLLILVGATRAFISPTISAGSYSGTFTVTVIY